MAVDLNEFRKKYTPAKQEQQSRPNYRYQAGESSANMDALEQFRRQYWAPSGSGKVTAPGKVTKKPRETATSAKAQAPVAPEAPEPAESKPSAFSTWLKSLSSFDPYAGYAVDPVTTANMAAAPSNPSTMPEAPVSAEKFSYTPESGRYRPTDQTAASQRSPDAANEWKRQQAEPATESGVVDWEGRSRLINELNQIDIDSGYATDEMTANALEARRRDIIAELEAGDAAAGNPTQVYSGADRGRAIFSGSTRQFVSGYLNAVGTALDFLKESSIALGGSVDPNAGFATDELSAAQINPKAATASDFEDAQRLVDTVQTTADNLGQSAAKDLEAAKYGLSSLGQAGVDIAANIIQMGYDAALGGLPSMFVRSSGSAAQEARLQGADVFHQAAYGAVSGGIEVLTEKMFDGVARIYGAGAADEVIEELIRKLTKSDFGRTALRWASGAFGEGLEEVVSSMLAPFAERIYNEDALTNGYWGALNPSEILYEFVIGAAIGGLGGGASVFTGQDAAANYELRMRDAAEESTAIGSGMNDIDMMATAEDGRGNQAPTTKREAVERQFASEAQAQVDGILSGETVSNRMAEQIVNDPEMAQAFAELTGVELTGTKSEQRKAVKDAAANYGKPQEAHTVTGEEAQQTEEKQTVKVTPRPRVAVEKQTAEEAPAQRATVQVKAENRRTVMNGIIQREAEKTGAEISDDERATLAEAFNADDGIKGSTYAAAVVEAYQLGKEGKVSLEEARSASSKGSAISNAQFERAYELGKRATQGVTLDANLRGLGRYAGDAASVFEDGQDAAAYGSAMTEAITRYTSQGVDVAPVVQSDRKSGGTLGVLTDAQVAKATEIGQKMQAAQDRAAKKRGESLRSRKRAGARQEGKVTYASDSGTVGGAAYTAVNRSKLSGTQKAVANIAEAVAKHTGLDIRVADFGSGVGGAYVPGTGGVLYLNINASFDGANIAAGSLGHELTHFLQEYAPEDYRTLKKIIAEEFNKDPQAYASIFEARQATEGHLTPDQITDEMAANACQTMLADPEVVQRIVNEHRSLAERLRDFILRIIDDIKAAFSEIDTSSNFPLYQEVRAAEGAMDRMREAWLNAFGTATENLQAEKAEIGSYNLEDFQQATDTDGKPLFKGGMSSEQIREVMQKPVDNIPITNITQNVQQMQRLDDSADDERTAGLDTTEQTKVQFQRYVEDEKTAKFLQKQEDAGKVVHTYKSFLEIDGKLYPPMAVKEKGEDGKYRMRNAIEPGRWVESEGNTKNIIIDPKNGKGYFLLKKDEGTDVKAAYNPYQHSSNLMLNDQFTAAYSRPNLVTYECIIPESELTSGYRAEYAKDAVGLHPWKSGPVAGKLAKAKGVERQVYLSRWLKPVRKVPESEVARHYKELLAGTDVAVPSNVVPPALLRALEDAGVKIEYDERAPKQERAAQLQRWDNNDDTKSERSGRSAAYTRLQNENAILKDTVRALKKQGTKLAKLQKQLQLTKDPETRQSDARKLAKALIVETGSEADVNKIADEIKKFGDTLLQADPNQLTEEALKTQARAIASEILSNAQESVTLDDEAMDVNPYDAYMSEATEDLANRIVMDAMNGVLRPTAPTKADRQLARTKALQEHIQQLKAEQKMTQREAASLYHTIYDLSVALDRAESRYATLRTEADYRAAQARAEGAVRAAEIKAKERARANDLLWEKKEHYLEMARQARERRGNTATRGKIRKLIADLNQRLARPTEFKHVPKELTRATIDLLEMIDDPRNHRTEKGALDAAARIADIRQVYESYKSNPDFPGVYDETVSDMLDNLALTLRGTPLSNMNGTQLSAVYRALQSLTHVVNNAVKVKIGNEERAAYDMAAEMTRETREVPKAQKGWIKEHGIPAHLRADVAFDRFGGFKKNSTWLQAARLLNDGQLKQTQLKMELSLPFAELFNNQKALADYTGVNALGKIDAKKLVDVGLRDENGEAIPITRDFMVALYMDLLNEDNRRHFIRGGKTVPDFQAFYDGKGGYDIGSRRAVGISGELSELYRERGEAKGANYADWSDDVNARINALEAEGEKHAAEVQAKIESLMTDYDRAWVKATQQLMDVDSKRELNKTTMEVYGIEKASVENYFPIFTDKDFVASPMETVTKDASLENAGFMKERVKSGNPTRAVGSVWAVTQQIDRVAQYCGLMPAIRNFGKVYSKTQSGWGDSLKKAISVTFGKAGTDYVENLIADLTGSRTQAQDELGLNNLLGSLRGNLARSTLTLNPRVALAQAASFPTAAAELGYKPIAKALAHGGKDGRLISPADKELIAKWSPLLWYRMQGYATPELGDIQGSNRLGDRVWRKMRFVTGWIQAVDGATVGRLWYAAEYWVQAHKPTLEKGSDAYYEAVADKFNAVVEHTQPNYTTMQRAAILRNPNSLIKTFTMFMTQRLQNFNILYDVAGRYQKARADFANNRNGVTKEDVSEARNNVTRAVTSQIAAQAMFVGIKVAVDFLLHSIKRYRDDETGDITEESTSLAILDAFCDAMVGTVIFGSELYGIAKAATGHGKWYGLSLNGVDTVSDLIESMVNLANGTYDLKDEKSRKTLYNRTMKLAANIAQALGYPLNNALKMGQAVYYHIVDAANGEFLSYEAGYDRTKAQNANKIILALENGDEAAVQAATEAFESEKEAMSAVRAQVKKQYEAGDRTAEDAVSILEKAGMDSNDAWFSVNSWETGDGSKYTAAKRAAFSGDKGAFHDAMKDLTAHGVKEKDVYSEINGFVKKAYFGSELGEEEAKILGDKKLSDADARIMLAKYCGLTADEATKQVEQWHKDRAFEAVYGFKYSQRKSLYLEGDVSRYDVRKALMSYDSMTGAEADLEIEAWEWSRDVPGAESISTEAVGKYKLYCESVGVSKANYVSCWKFASNVEGDKDANGKTIAYSAAKKVLAEIGKLNISTDQKNAIALCFYAEKTVSKYKTW